MLLTQYDEQAHIEYEKELSFEEGKEVGKEEEIEEGRKSERARFAKLCQLLENEGRDADIKKALYDTDYCDSLYNEFSL